MSQCSCEAGVLNSFVMAPLKEVGVHKWLGVLWPGDLDITSFLHRRLQTATVALDLDGLQALLALGQRLGSSSVT